MRKSTFVLILCLVLFFTGTAHSGQLEDAIAAGERGDFSKALKLFRPLAKKGIAEAQFHLGALYDLGLGIPEDNSEAVRWWRKAAEQGHAIAQHNLGVSFAGGSGVLEDDAEAVRWLGKAAEQGYPEAQFNLGVMYYFGEGVPQSTSVAVDWIYQAGVNFLETGQRELALTAYDQLNESSPGHYLGRKLQEALYPEDQ